MLSTDRGGRACPADGATTVDGVSSADTAAPTLAGWLRHQPDDVLARLLATRPDLLHPVPADISVLASRAGGRVSVDIAIDRLHLGAIQVIEALALLPEPTTVDDLAELLRVDPAALAPAIQALRDAVIVWGDGGDLRLLSVVRDLLPFPAALGPPARLALAEIPAARLPGLLADLSALLGEPAIPTAGAEPAGAAQPATAADNLLAIAATFEDPARLEALLNRLPDRPREVVELLAAGPPFGRMAGATRIVDAASADTPLRWLLAHGVLVAIDDYTVALPREIGLLLRGGTPFPHVVLDPPALNARTHSAADVDSTAASQAFTVVRLIESMLERWGVEPPSVLRAGGLGVRDLRRTTRELDVEPRLAAFLIEIAHAAGLIGPDEIGESWLPTLGTSGYDAWLLRPLASRWCTLATAWLTTTRMPALVGRRGAPELEGADAPGQSGRPPSAQNALGPDLDRALAPVVRRDVLRLLDDAGVGQAPEPAAMVDVLAWLTPRRGGQLRDDIARWSLEEAEILGFTGRGALSSFGRLLAGAILAEQSSDDDPVAIAAATLEPLLPQPLDYVLLQADLTAVAPGPLESELSRELSLVADVESTGGATVFRFSAVSIRRALDAGRSADDVHALLARRSRTPVPQPLSYLVDDVARKFGRVRVGLAGAYARCDDPAVLNELLADRRVEGLRLHRLAPTVVVSPLSPERVAQRLRELGYAPAAETPDGGLLLRRPDSKRAPARARSPRRRTELATPAPAIIDTAVRAIRGGDKAATASRRNVVGGSSSDVLPHSASTETLAMLKDAVATGQPLWMGYLNAQGQASNRIVEPLRLAGGYLTAYDHRREEVRTFAVHRITGIASLDDAAVAAEGSDDEEAGEAI